MFFEVLFPMDILRVIASEPTNDIESQPVHPSPHRLLLRGVPLLEAYLHVAECGLDLHGAHFLRRLEFARTVFPEDWRVNQLLLLLLILDLAQLLLSK